MEAVDCIDHQVRRTGQNLIKGFPVYEEVQDLDLAVGIDLKYPFLGDLGLKFTQIAFQGQKLAVKIGVPNPIEVHEAEAADAGTGQGLCGISSHRTQADHRDKGPLEPLKSLVPEECPQTDEAFFMGRELGSQRSLVRNR
jgi:hypothetical protein